MAKSKSFYGLRRGSTKTLTFSVLKGQQITKDRVTDVANPQTNAQMVQRMLFAQAVKFYKQALANFFKFAFEGKKPLESDYNAFVRLNTGKSIAIDKENYLNVAYPSVGNFQVTQGSLPWPEPQWSDGNDELEFYVDGLTGDDETMAQLSQKILASYPKLMNGDIITFVVVNTALDEDAELIRETAPAWDIHQMVIDVNDNRAIQDVFPENFKINEGYIGLPADYADHINMGTVVFSRNTPKGLIVSDSFMVPNRNAWMFIMSLDTDAAKRQCARTWGATEQAILQGSLAQEEEEATAFALIAGGNIVTNNTDNQVPLSVEWKPTIARITSSMNIKINGEVVPKTAANNYYNDTLKLGIAIVDGRVRLIVGPRVQNKTVSTIEIEGVVYKCV